MKWNCGGRKRRSRAMALRRTHVFRRCRVAEMATRPWCARLARHRGSGSLRCEPKGALGMLRFSASKRSLIGRSWGGRSFFDLGDNESPGESARPRGFVSLPLRELLLDEFHPAVCLPAFGRIVAHLRFGGAESFGFESRGIDSLADQVGLHGRGAFLG